MDRPPRGDIDDPEDLHAVFCRGPGSDPARRGIRGLTPVMPVTGVRPA
jgi:hypothetical protein